MGINFAWAGLRLFVFLGVGLGIGVLANIGTHRNYWKGTIYAVQTVDFNILSHMLPYKLSTLILANNKEEIERTINSNKALFGIIITDCKTETIECPNQRILYANKSEFNDWSEINLENLKMQYFNYLKDPPPLSPETEYPTPSTQSPIETGLTNPGIIIGRVYYIRVIAPSFLDDYETWINRHLLHFSIGGIQRYYIYFGVHIAFLLTALLSWFYSELQRHYQKQEVERSKQLFQTENKLLETQKQEAERAQQLLEAKNKLLRISTFNNVFSQLIDQEFTSVAANVAQRLSNALFSVIARLKTDTQNIIHDVKKAPLLSSVDFIEEVKKDLSDTFSLTETHPIIEEISQLISTTSDSVEILEIAIDDLRNITDIDGQQIDVNVELLMIQDRLHPSVKRWKLHFELCPESPKIKCNSWHLKSIVRNALYNSSASLRDRYFECLQENQTFQGEIRISSSVIDDKVIVSVIDNGCGIPEHLIPELYQTDKRLNNSAGESKGNGSIIINAYLRLHEGEARVFNNKDSGATVQFAFPLTKPSV